MALFVCVQFANAEDQIRGGLEFAFANPLVTSINGTDFFQTDIMLKASEAGMRLGTGIVLINYNPELFGTYVKNQANVQVSMGELIHDPQMPLYSLIVNDNGPSRLAVTFYYSFYQGYGSLLNTSWQKLAQIRIKLLHKGYYTGLSFAQNLMQQQQYQDDNSSLFSPVIAQDIQNIYIPKQPEANLALNSGVVTIFWDAQPDCVYNVYSASQPQASEWQLEASELNQALWIENSSSRAKFYRIIAISMQETDTGD